MIVIYYHLNSSLALKLSAASKHTTAPTNHSRPSLRKHLPDDATAFEVADIWLQLTTNEITVLALSAVM